MLKKNKSINLSVATQIPKSPSMEIVNDNNIFKPRNDPKLQKVEDYVQYYNNKMQPLSDCRKKYQEGSEYYQVFKNNSHLNRYNSVIPIQMTQPINQKYFNGNIVPLGNFQFLIAQAPIDLEQFYDVIYNFDTQVILQLTKYAEHQQPKADRYVPLAQEEDEAFINDCVEAQYASYALQKQKKQCTDNVVFVTQQQIDEQRTRDPKTFWWYKNLITIEKHNLQVQTTNLEKIEDQFYIYNINLQKGAKNDNSVSLSGFSEQQPKDIKFIYYGQWDDHGVISCQKILDLCQRVSKIFINHQKGKLNDLTDQVEIDSNLMDNQIKKIVIHCSAGIGRSAVFAVCLYIYESFKFGDLITGEHSWQRLKISIYDSVERLRVCRNPQCINTPDQFAFLFDFCNFCQDHFRINKQNMQLTPDTIS